MTPNEWAYVTIRVMNLTTTTQAGARMLQVIEEAITKAIAEALEVNNSRTDCCVICGAALDSANSPFPAAALETINATTYPEVRRT
jgi:hypothetical protein